MLAFGRVEVEFTSLKPFGTGGQETFEANGLLSGCGEFNIVGTKGIVSGHVIRLIVD